MNINNESNNPTNESLYLYVGSFKILNNFISKRTKINIQQKPKKLFYTNPVNIINIIFFRIYLQYLQ